MLNYLNYFNSILPIFDAAQNSATLQKTPLSSGSLTQNKELSSMQ